MAKTPTLQETYIVKTLKNEHRQILALFQLYLATEADSRQPIADQILQRLEEHFKMEEGLLDDGVRNQKNRVAIIEHIFWTTKRSRQ